MFRRSADSTPAGRGNRLLREVVGSSWRSTAVLLLVSLADTAATLALPAAIAAAADQQILGVGPAWALPALAGVLAVIVVADMIGQLATVAGNAAATRSLRHRLLYHVLALGLRGRFRFATGDAVSRLVGNTTSAATIGPTLTAFVTTTVTSAGGLAGLFLTDARLGVTFLAGLPIGWIIVRRYCAQNSHLYGRYLSALGDISGRLVDALSGIRTIRASGTAERETDRILGPLPELGAAGRGLWQIRSRASWQVGLFAAVVQLAVLSVAGFGVSDGRMTPGQLLASIGYVTLALGLVAQVSTMTALTRERSSAARLAEILDEPIPRQGTAMLPPGPPELVLDGITVRHGDRVVLDGLSLRVPPGRSVAIVGTSAAGKSTLAGVAGRLLTPDTGKVLLSGVPLDTIDPAVLRREVTYAFERPTLLGTTVADAIAFGAGRLPREQIVAAAVMAGADEFIRRLPDGYETKLGEAPMSGGERQRLGLARSIARCGRLLILDDATSSLDTVTELRVSQALSSILAGRTCLVIAHRPAIVARCDLVAWLDNGRIRALAPHGVLWRDAEYRGVFGSAAVEEPACAF